jgi:hypothetical protein
MTVVAGRVLSYSGCMGGIHARHGRPRQRPPPLLRTKVPAHGCSSGILKRKKHGWCLLKFSAKCVCGF